MAVRILNDFPDVEVHRGEPAQSAPLFRALPAPRTRAPVRGRAKFIVITLALHAVAFAGFVSASRVQQVLIDPEPMEASIVESPATAEPPPEYTPPVVEIQYSLPMPQELSFETESIAPPPVVATAAIAPPSPQAVVPPVIESVEYVRAPSPVYPQESSRRRERGTVILRVLVDAAGRPAQIRVERSSGFERLDTAARVAVEKALFRPHEVNGIAQPAQVLIPIEFTRRAS
jgi:TonB family protein